MVLSHSRTAGRPASANAALDRRFEAVVFDWDGTGVPDRTTDASPARVAVERLCALGMDVFVVSGTHVVNVDGQLLARPAGPGRLFLCLNRGSEVFAVDASGPERISARVATPTEDARLDEAARLTIERLGRAGLTAEVVSSRLNRRKIDLIPEPEWSDPPKAFIDRLLRAVEDRLRIAGLERLRDAVDVAMEASRESGLHDPRITSDAKHVEIGLTDKSDSARWIFEELWRVGIDPRRVLVAGDEFGSIGGLPGSDSLMIVREAAGATFISVGVEPEGVPQGVLALGGGPETFLSLLEDQIRRRARGDVPDVGRDPAWSLSMHGLDIETERAKEALLTVADGVIGSSGAPAARNEATAPDVLAQGLFVGTGAATELARAPTWNVLPFTMDRDAGLYRVIDLRAGLLRQEITQRHGRVETLAFSSLARPGVVVFRAQGPADLLEPGSGILVPREDAITGADDGHRWMRIGAGPGGLVVAASETHQNGSPASRLERIGAYVVDWTAEPRLEDALKKLDAAEQAGFETLLAEHRRAWAGRWAEADVVIDGDEELQQAIRVALFHLMSSVPDVGEAAVGARGLSGPGYRGHIFWDADVFVLPFLAATHPSAARAMLEYRIARLPAAIATARALGRRGARFPWESAHDGADVTPSIGRDPAGHVFPIRTGQFEEHIVADVAWGAATYLDWTGDEDFLNGPGRDLFIETARYWASRVRFTPDGRAHIYGVTGPDEYHEPVDDNAFTNVMARWNLRRAAFVAAFSPDQVEPQESEHWLKIADALVDNHEANSGLYEQFAGFWRLEPLVIADVAPRRPIAAELLLGRDRVRSAQVVKQADVLMLHHMVPDQVAPGSLHPNLEFYEPRTAHGSSLSPGIHASLFARAGRLTEADHALHLASRIDLDDLTGTSASGLHIATMGSVWQALAFGFAGLRPIGTTLRVDPRLSPAWNRFQINARFRGSEVCVRADLDAALITSQRPMKMMVGESGPVVDCGPAGVRLERAGEGWKVLQS